ncbi:hypothetical protein AB0J72_54355, partial [Dactylosporangium sp. NPDC049742]
LALLADLPPDPRWHAVRADLLARAGRHAEAVEALTSSLAGTVTDVERRHREQRLAELRGMA